ncbi:MAG: hypothetical protein R2880_19900 [Deinococcales bacterium]
MMLLVVGCEQDPSPAENEAYREEETYRASIDEGFDLELSAAQSWQLLGTAITEGATLSTQPKIVFDSQNHPIVAYSVYVPTGDKHHIYVKRWNGTAWQRLGGVLNVALSYSATQLSLAIQNDQPVVAWFERRSTGGGSPGAYVKRWDGTAWQLLGGKLQNNNNAIGFSPKLAVDSNNGIIVAFQQSDSFYFQRWASSEWEEIARFESLGNNQLELFLLNKADNPIIVWKQEIASNQYRTKVCRWNGLRWQNIGNFDHNSYSYALAIAQGLRGNLYLVVIENSSSIVREWDARARVWQAVGDPLGIAGGPHPAEPKLIIQGYRRPVVTWYDARWPGANREVYVQRWNGQSWVNLGEQPVVAYNNRGYNLTLDRNNTISLAYAEFRSAYDGGLYVKQFR